jgi:hypothetical protein
MMKHIVLDGMYWLNFFPSTNDISTTMSPFNIVLGTPSPYFKHLKLRTGAYVQLYVGTKNTTKARTVGTIALRKLSKSGSYYFMSLKTGRELHGYEWTELPIDDHVIATVKEMAEAERQPIMANGPIFEWSPGVYILDDDDDEEELKKAIDALEHGYNLDIESDDSEGDDVSNNGLINVPNYNNNNNPPDGVITQSEKETDENKSVASSEGTAPGEADDNKKEEHVEDTEHIDTHDEARSAQPLRANAGAGVTRLQPVFGGGKFRPPTIATRSQ